MIAATIDAILAAVFVLSGYLTLLAPLMRDGAPVLASWRAISMQGSHVDLLDGRLRIYGLPWQGAATNRSMEGLAQALETAHATENADGVEYRILMMHTGLEGIVPRVQGSAQHGPVWPLRAAWTTWPSVTCINLTSL